MSTAFTLKAISELPAEAVSQAGRGRAPVPTQFDKNPLVIDQLYGVEVPNTEVEGELLKEARRWASRQTPPLNVRKAGQVPLTAMGPQKRTVYIQAYVPTPRPPKEAEVATA